VVIASYDFFCKQTIVLFNKQQLQWATYVVPRWASTYHRSYYSMTYGVREDLDYTGAHRIKHMHNFYFILFVSSRFGMCGRLNSHVCNDRWNSQWRLRHSGIIVKELNTVWLNSVLLHLMCLIFQCAACMKKEQLALNFWYCTLWSKK